MTYRDICFCHASNKQFCAKNNVPICTNTNCMRHASTIPDNLQEWELFAYADFHQECKNYKPKNGLKIGGH